MGSLAAGDRRKWSGNAAFSGAITVLMGSVLASLGVVWTASGDPATVSADGKGGIACIRYTVKTP